MAEEKADGQSEVEVEKQEAIMVPLTWSDMGSAVYANQALVYLDDDALHLGFFQVNPPVSFVLSNELRKQAIQEQRPVAAQCVAHIAWPAAKLETMIRVLTECLSKRREREARERK